MKNSSSLLIKNLLMLLIFIGVSLLLYIPSYGRTFASDDYCVLRYLFIGDHLIVPGFFRPVGDLTLKWTFALFGWNPTPFFLINVILHGLNSWLLFLFCKKIFPEKTNAMLFAVMASGIFLFYHSLGETILWTIGRGISLAVTFSLLAMLIFAGGLNSFWKYFLACICYFIAISAYENVLLLPLVLWMIPVIKKQKVVWTTYVIAFSLPLAVNFGLRVLFSGKLWAAYKGVIFWKSFLAFAADFGRMMFRTFIPSFNHPLMFAITAIVLISITGWITARNFRAFTKNYSMQATILFAVCGILCGCLIGMFFGVSTRTPEGDRLLYFPACFYSMLIALLLLQMKTARTRSIIFILLICIQGYFVFSTQNNWIRASEYSQQIFKKVGSSKERPLYIVNLPSDYNGAYVCRNCFKEALIHNNTDSSGVFIVNDLDYIMAERKEGTIGVDYRSDSIFIWPETTIYYEKDFVTGIRSGKFDLQEQKIPLSSILYWDKGELKPLK